MKETILKKIILILIIGFVNACSISNGEFKLDSKDDKYCYSGTNIFMKEDGLSTNKIEIKEISFFPPKYINPNKSNVHTQLFYITQNDKEHEVSYLFCNQQNKNLDVCCIEGDGGCLFFDNFAQAIKIESLRTYKDRPIFPPGTVNLNEEQIEALEEYRNMIKSGDYGFLFTNNWVYKGECK